MSSLITLLSLNLPFQIVSSFNGFYIHYVELGIIILSCTIFSILFFSKKNKAYNLLGWLTIVVSFLLTIASLIQSAVLASAVFGILLLFVVIFQSEFKELTTGLSSKVFSKDSSQSAMDESAIDAICVACHSLSSKRTGALIVLERNMHLEEVLRSGIVFDAKVNSYLIRNIFYNGAPLHDGAMVISGGKIVAASCILPLTDRLDIDQDLGTRHRAALGVSEISDAIAIVVSEETGNISIAFMGELTRDYTYQSLHTFLVKNFLQKQ